jgi:hypothetical protein
VEITEVFEIEMGKIRTVDKLKPEYVTTDLKTLQLYGTIKKAHQEFYMNILPENPNEIRLTKRSETEDLAKRDGFKSSEDMFKWFNEQYDLSKPKRFTVYRWKWGDLV